MPGFLKSGNAPIVRLARRAIGRPTSSRLRLLERMPRGGVCAEIGVWKGDFSDRILRYANPKSLHLIDPWPLSTSIYRTYVWGGSAKNQDDMDCIFQGVRDRFALADLRMCLAKTKPGGRIAGDDYHWGTWDGYPVRRAVLDFAAQNSLERRLTVLDSQFIIETPS